ncbi:hypothetical protein [Aquimarina latercula]|uniref:hypothetical protein n=1 Tax=Aquimarina latercula TaxID=987 RepID=UPI00041BE5D0|nr:hypothetical protein [Aquimarina latercula]
MKKITLLLVAAVFVIGIQSCSTEETSIIEEEVQQTLEENDSKFNWVPHCNFFVRYPVDWTQEDRDDFHIWARENWFSSILVLFEDGCYAVDEWRVPCSELEKVTKTDIASANATDAGTKTENDDEGVPTIIYTLKAKNGYYDNCYDVPLHGQL